MYNGTPQTGQMLAILFSLDLSNIEKSFKQLNFSVAKFENKFLSFCDFFLFRAAFKFRLRLHLEIRGLGFISNNNSDSGHKWAGAALTFLW